MFLFNRSLTNEQLPEMVAQLKLDLASPKKKEQTHVPSDGQPEQAKSSDNTNHQQNPAHVLEDLSSALEAYGLPTSFGKSKKTTKPGDDDEDPPEDRPINLKRSHESDTEESPNDRLKAAFELMGYAFSDPANRSESADSIINITGEVVYRKKHIRLHNRVLKMKHHRPKHTYFDDDGNEIAPPAGSEKEDTAPEALIHTSSDDDDPSGAVPPRSVSSSVRSSTILEYNQLQNKDSEDEHEEEKKQNENPPSEEALDHTGLLQVIGCISNSSEYHSSHLSYSPPSRRRKRRNANRSLWPVCRRRSPTTSPC